MLIAVVTEIETIHEVLKEEFPDCKIIKESVGFYKL